jgi:hypothetical protein
MLPVPKPSTTNELKKMKEAFRKGGITEEMIRGERTDGFIDYDEETGVARWETITRMAPPSKQDNDAEQARMKEAFRKGGITEEMIRGERTDGFINYDEETGVAKWETITRMAPPSKPGASTKAQRRRQ